jgi:hypothetical protein
MWEWTHKLHLKREARYTLRRPQELRSAMPSEIHRKRKGKSDWQSYLPDIPKRKLTATRRLLDRCVAKGSSNVIDPWMATFARNGRQHRHDGMPHVDCLACALSRQGHFARVV